MSAPAPTSVALAQALSQAESHAHAWLFDPSMEDMPSLETATLQALDAMKPSDFTTEDKAFLLAQIHLLDRAGSIGCAMRNDPSFASSFATACSKGLSGPALDQAHIELTMHITGPSTPIMGLALARQLQTRHIERHGQAVDAWHGLFSRFGSEFDRQDAIDICHELFRLAPPPSNLLSQFTESGGSLAALEGLFDAMPDFMARQPFLAQNLDVLGAEQDDMERACALLVRALDLGLDPAGIEALNTTFARALSEREARLLAEHASAAPCVADRKPRL